MILADEYAEFSQYQNFLKKFSVLGESKEKYFISFLNILVIDSDGTDHVIGNFNIFSSF